VIRSEVPLRMRLLMYAVIAGIFSFLAWLTWLGSCHLYVGLQPNVSVDRRIDELTFAVISLFLPILIVWFFIKRKWTTGRWLGSTPAEKARVAAMREARIAGKSTAEIRELICESIVQAPSWTKYLRYWAADKIYDHSATRKQSYTALAITALYALFVLGVTAFAGISFIAAFDADNSISQTFLFFMLGLVILIYPVFIVLKEVNRFRSSGRIVATEDEWLRVEAHYKRWIQSEGKKSIGGTIVTYTVICALLFVMRFKSSYLQSHLPHFLNTFLWWTVPLCLGVIVNKVIVKFGSSMRSAASSEDDNETQGI